MGLWLCLARRSRMAEIVRTHSKQRRRSSRACVRRLRPEAFCRRLLGSDCTRVSLAARIEKLNKLFDSQLLISEIVWQAVSDDQNKAVPMGQVEVRGREQAI